ncbi:hypothetical protein [Dyella solisilvae]|uniref:hypothetical protein n=1 Tax=Dyella solisilvae TaxID=1920168 RepID=UPI0011C032E6|nr:hypothetical protein [Dyella solisilvae]
MAYHSLPEAWFSADPKNLVPWASTIISIEDSGFSPSHELKSVLYTTIHHRQAGEPRFREAARRTSICFPFLRHRCH